MNSTTQYNPNYLATGSNADLKIIIWSILLGVLTAFIILLVLTRENKKPETKKKHKSFFKLILVIVFSIAVLGTGFYFLLLPHLTPDNPIVFFNESLSENFPIVRFPTTGSESIPQTMMTSFKSLYTNQTDRLITLSLLASIILLAVAVFRNVARERGVDKAKTEFVSLASHQLRTPTTAIKWYSEMLLGEEVGILNAKQKKYIKEISHGNQRMIDLVNTLLSVSRIELGTFAIKPGRANIATIADDVLEELQTQIKNKGLKVEREYEKDVSVIESDRKLIRIIFQNLLSNAVAYTPMKGKIFVRIEKTDIGVHIEIEDNGCGIPQNAGSKIYTKFFRADNARAVKPDGTGLGLYIVKSIVDALGGTISFKSEEKEGTIFYVNIYGRDMTIEESRKKLT